MSELRNETLPQVLYRYRPMSKTLASEIEFNTAYFCPLKNLNDDLEGTFDYDQSTPEDLRQSLINRACEENEIPRGVLMAAALA
jgi:hypothetical protein